MSVRAPGGWLRLTTAMLAAASVLGAEQLPRRLAQRVGAQSGRADPGAAAPGFHPFSRRWRAIAPRRPDSSNRSTKNSAEQGRPVTPAGAIEGNRRGRRQRLRKTRGRVDLPLVVAPLLGSPQLVVAQHWCDEVSDGRHATLGRRRCAVQYNPAVTWMVRPC